MDEWKLEGYMRDILDEVEMETGLTIVTKPVIGTLTPFFGMWPEGVANNQYDALLVTLAWQTTYGNPLDIQDNYVMSFPIYSGGASIMTLKTTRP
jgi:hypothetical protein